tara:strand:+ start:15790 stop:16236 length:447 start_codon:yes stop_codon:yes gene_type:complete
LITVGLVGVDLVDGEARGGDPWGSGVVWSCGVCTGGAMLPPCEGVCGCEARVGLPANAPFAAFGGRPRFRGFPSSAPAVSGVHHTLRATATVVRTVVGLMQVAIAVLGRATALEPSRVLLCHGLRRASEHVWRRVSTCLAVYGRPQRM